MNHWLWENNDLTVNSYYAFSLCIFPPPETFKKESIKYYSTFEWVWITSASVKAHLSTWQCESVKANKGKKGSCTLALAELSSFSTRERHPRDSCSILHKLSETTQNVSFWMALYCISCVWYNSECPPLQQSINKYIYLFNCMDLIYLVLKCKGKGGKKLALFTTGNFWLCIPLVFLCVLLWSSYRKLTKKWLTLFGKYFL